MIVYISRLEFLLFFKTVGIAFNDFLFMNNKPYHNVQSR